MGDNLPFPIKLVFLLLVLPVALVYLASAGGIAFLLARRGLSKLASRLHSSRRPQPPRP